MLEAHKNSLKPELSKFWIQSFRLKKKIPVTFQPFFKYSRGTFIKLNANETSFVFNKTLKLLLKAVEKKQKIFFLIDKNTLIEKILKNFFVRNIIFSSQTEIESWKIVWDNFFLINFRKKKNIFSKPGVIFFSFRDYKKNLVENINKLCIPTTGLVNVSWFKQELLFPSFFLEYNSIDVSYAILNVLKFFSKKKNTSKIFSFNQTRNYKSLDFFFEKINIDSENSYLKKLRGKFYFWNFINQRYLKISRLFRLPYLKYNRKFKKKNFRKNFKQYKK